MCGTRVSPVSYSSHNLLTTIPLDPTFVLYSLSSSATSFYTVTEVCCSASLTLHFYLLLLTSSSVEYYLRGPHTPTYVHPYKTLVTRTVFTFGLSERVSLGGETELT